MIPTGFRPRFVCTATHRCGSFDHQGRSVALLAAVLLLLFTPSWAGAQASLDSGGIEETARFFGNTPQDVGDPNHGIEAIILSRPFAHHVFWGRSVGTVPVLLSAKNVTATPALPLSDTDCLTLQAVNPVTGLPGVVYEIWSETEMGPTWRWFYVFDDVTAPPLSPFADPVANTCATDPNTLSVLVEECPGLARIHFVDAAAWFNNDPHVIVPVLAESYDVRAVGYPATPPFPHVSQREQFHQSGDYGGAADGTVITFATRGGVDTRVEYHVIQGSDPDLDTFVAHGYAIVDGATPLGADDTDHQVVPCDYIRDFYVPIPSPTSLCSISGKLDLIGETEHCVSAADVFARQGPSGNQRGAQIGGSTPASEPCDTANHPNDWILRNLACGSYGYVGAFTHLRNWSTKLFWPTLPNVVPAPPGLGPGNDLGNIFVTQPGVMSGEIRMTTGSPALDGLRHVWFTPHTEADRDFYRSAVTARTPDQDGQATTRYDLGATFTAATGTQRGRYEMVVAGQYGQDWPWRVEFVEVDTMSPVPNPADTTGLDPFAHLDGRLSVRESRTSFVDVPMGGPPVEEDLDYCFSRVTVLFRSNVPFHDPILQRDNDGRYPESGPRDYDVFFDIARGLPLFAEPRFVTSSQVTTYLPQAFGYSFTARVQTQSGTSAQVPVACDVNVGCGQDIVLSGELTLNVQAPACAAPNGSADIVAEAFTCSASPAADVVEVRWENLTNGTSGVVCAGSCEGSHSFSVPGLAACDNRIRVIARDNLVPQNESSVVSIVRDDNTPPTVVGGCPMVVVSPTGMFGGLTWTDDCPGDLVATYAPPLSTTFPVGDHVVTSVATAACNSAVCQFILRVEEPQEPTCNAGADVTGACDGAQLHGAAMSATGTPLTLAWTSNCAGTVFTPSATVLEPFVTFGTDCDVDCTLTLTVTDAGGTCSDQVRVTLDDTLPPVLSGVPANAIVPCDGVPAAALVTATDNCAPSVVPVFTEVRTNGSCPDTYVLTRTWTATDRCANSSTGSQVLTVRDLTPPVLAGVPANAIVPCDGVPAPALVTATDNCAPSVVPVFAEVRTNGSCLDTYVITRTWTATDRCANSSTGSQVLTVRDLTPPVLAGVPANATVSCENVPAAALVTATDNCAPSVVPVFAEVRTNGSCLDTYVITRTWTATDRCANSSTGSQVLTVRDLTPPVLAGVPVNATVSCENVPAAALVTATDNCAPSVVPVFAEVRTNGSCLDTYVITRTWTATDRCANSSTGSQVLTVRDLTPPVLAGVPANATVSCEDVPAAAPVTATDNCAPSVVPVFAEVRTNGSCPDTYVITRTWTATDRCANSSTGSQVLTVRDLTPPVLAGVPANATVSCENVPAAAPVTATDNCAPSVVPVFAEVRTNGSCPDTYVITRTWTATDRCANSSTGSQVLTVRDLTPPVLAGVPANAIVSCENVPAAAPVTATDNCAPSVVPVFAEVRTNGSCPDTYVITRTWTATDRCANSSTGSQVLTVRDLTPPVLAGVPASVALTCDQPLPDPAAVSAADNCDTTPSVVFMQVRMDGPCVDSFTLTRTWTATDRCGNAAAGSQVIVVTDTAAPVVTALLSPAEPRPPHSAATACSTPASRLLIVRCSAVDACDPAPVVAAVLVATVHDVLTANGPCLTRIERVPVACNATVEVRLVAPPCPAKPPRSPLQVVSFTPAGLMIVTAGHVTLEVTATDRCGNAAVAQDDPATPPPAPCDEALPDRTCCPRLAPPTPDKCRVPRCD